MKIKPLQDKILVKRSEAEKKTAGGIIIPDTSKEKPSIGTVISVGPGARNEKGELVPMTLKEGDKILFSDSTTIIVILYNSGYKIKYFPSS